MALDEATIARAREWLQGRFDDGATAVNPTSLARAEAITEAEATAIMLRAAEVSEGFEIRGNTKCPNCLTSYRVTGASLDAIAASHEAMKKRQCSNCHEVFGEELELRFTFFPQGGPASPPPDPVGGTASAEVTTTAIVEGKVAEIKRAYDQIPAGTDVTIIHNHFHAPVHMGNQGNKTTTTTTTAGGDALVAVEGATATKGDGGSKKWWVPIVVACITAIAGVVGTILTLAGVLFGGGD